MNENRFFSERYPENVFICLGIIFGLLFLLVTPPFQAGDEPEHFFRAFQVSELGIVAQRVDEKPHPKVGGDLPQSLAEVAGRLTDHIPFHPERKQKPGEILSSFRIPLSPENRTFMEFANTALYSPIAYLPQALGIATGRVLRLPPIALLYTGRIFNLFIWILLVYMSIKTTPFKWIFFLLALTPMSLFQASSLSADGFTNGLSFLLIAMFLNYSLGKDTPMKFMDLLAIFFFTLLLSLSKHVYFLIMCLFLLIPLKRIGTRRRYIVVFVFLCLLNIMALALWYSVSASLYIPFPGRVLEGAVISPKEQMSFILDHPVYYLKAILRTCKLGRELVQQFIGCLGWLDTPLPEWLIWSYWSVLMLVALIDNKAQPFIKYKEKMLLGATWGSIAALISTAMYLTWTSLGGGIIDGLQGRYFIPIMPLSFVLLNNKRLSFSSKRFGLAIISFATLVLSLTVIILIKRYYI